MPYIYGKRNNLYLVQLGYNIEQQLLPSVVMGNVGIGIKYGGGLTLAISKPYVLKLIYPYDTTTGSWESVREEVYGSPNSERFTNSSLVLGKGRWSTGLNQLRWAPGLYAECAIVITPSKSKAFVQSITLGGKLQFIPKSFPFLWTIRPNDKDFVCLQDSTWEKGGSSKVNLR